MSETPRKRCLLGAPLSLLLLLPFLLKAQSQEEFQRRRQAVRTRMEPNSVLVLRGPSSNQEEGRPRQDSNLYYLTGIVEPNTSLILYAESSPAQQPQRPVPAKEIFFYPAPSGEAPPSGGQWTATTKPLDNAGFENVRRSAEFAAELERILLGGPGVIHMDYRRSRTLNGPMTEDEQLLKQARDRGGSFTVKAASPLFADLRRVKSASEIDTLRTAAAITAEALKEAMRNARPGMYEYQIQSIIEHVFTFNGAARPGFSTIVGSGENSCILHWSDNTRQTRPGDVVVMDVGAQYRMYTADITRTIPISGTFTRRQRDVYDIVLRANEAAIEMVKPGADMRDISNKVSDILAEGLQKLALIKDRGELRKYYFHGMSHSIGLVVHDVGGLGRLEPGMVVTIEPGLYIREENLGVRIEDDVVVTEKGPVVITSAVPKKVEEVEAMMKQGSMDFRRYLLQK